MAPTRMSTLITPADRTLGSLPKQGAGKVLACLGREEPIEGVAMGHRVTASMEPMRHGDRQRFKVLGGNQLGQIIEQFAYRRQLAQVHLGGDLPARCRTHVHPVVTRVSHGLMDRWQEPIGLGQPPQQGMGIADGESWMLMIQDRNLTSHTYNRSTADAIAANIMERHLPCFHQLAARLVQRLQEEGP